MNKTGSTDVVKIRLGTTLCHFALSMAFLPISVIFTDFGKILSGFTVF